MVAFANPDTTYRGSTGTIVPATWTDVVNDDLNALYGDAAWSTLSLGTSITATGGWRTPSFRLDGTMVVFNGILSTTGSIAVGATVATLPAGYRPTQNVMSMYWNNSSNAPGQVRVMTTGAVVVETAVATTQNFSLDAVTFSIL